MMDSDNCAWCGSLKTAGPVCANCGADYAKAEAIKKHGKAQIDVSRSISSSAIESGFIIETVSSAASAEDPVLEKRLCIVAIPALLAAGFLVQITGLFANMQRIVFGMPVHELGHATVAWFCGFDAIPTVWKTISSTERGVVASFLLFIAIMALANYGRLKMKSGLILLAVCLLVLQGYGTFILSARDAEMYIVFGGDGVGMVLATLLMMTFYFGKETQLYKGGLRWGFGFIGAAAFADMFMTWWRSLSDRANVPYGLTGGEPTDAFKLIENFSWSWEQLINRHVNLGVVCLAVLLMVYLWGIKQASQAIKEQERREQSAGSSHETELPATEAGRLT
jgi:hypothetical protein